MKKSTMLFSVLSCALIAPTTLYAASFQGLGDLSGGEFRSDAQAISDDGSTVVGISKSASNTRPYTYQAFRWTATTGMVGLGYLNDTAANSEAWGVSADGSVIVGSSSSTNTYQSFRWTADTGITALAGLHPNQSVSLNRAYGISADASTVVGAGHLDSGFQTFRWTAGTGFADLGTPGAITADFEQAWAATPDGSIIVGSSVFHDGFDYEDVYAFKWTQATGPVTLPDLPGGDEWSGAMDISSNGNVIAGYGNCDQGFQAVRWINGQVTGLGELPGGDDYSAAWAISADGSIIVGQSSAAPGDPEAFIWDELHGIRSLQDVLINNYGLDLTGWTLLNASDITPDGFTIVGTGINPQGHREAWLADVPEPSSLCLLLTALPLIAKHRRKP